MIRIVEKILGILLMVVGLFGFAYFRRYHGELIPWPTLWFLLSVLIMVDLENVELKGIND